MIWVVRLFLLDLALFCGGLALGFGFDDGGKQVGFAEAMTTLAAAMYLGALLLLPISILLFLAVLIPKPTRPGEGRSNRVVLGTIYAVWLVVPLAVLVGAQYDASCREGGACDEWGVGNVVGGALLAYLPFPIWSLARRIAVRLTSSPRN